MGTASTCNRCCLHGNWFGMGYSGGRRVESITDLNEFIYLIRTVPPIDTLDYAALRHDVLITSARESGHHERSICIHCETSYLFCTSCTLLGLTASPILLCASLCCYDGDCCCGWISIAPKIPRRNINDSDDMILALHAVPRPMSMS